MDISHISPVTIREVCHEYERAASQTRQIQISSELHLLSKDTIKAILESQGYNLPKTTKKHKNIVTLTYNGKTQTLYQWSKETGIAVNTLRSRYYNGWDAESILEPTKGERETIIITYDGKTQSISQWAREIGISREVLRKRYLRGWDIEKILTTPLKGSQKNHA